MSATGSVGPGREALELPPFSLDVQTLDLGADVKAVGLELLETESREPVRGKEAAEIWAAMLPALAGNDFFVLDFFSHVDRVRDFCNVREIVFREAAERCLVLTQPQETICGSSSRGLKGKRSVLGRALRQRRPMRHLRASYRSGGWTPIKRRTRVTPFVRCASRKTDG
jgi:hypothetical protein